MGARLFGFWDERSGAGRPGWLKKVLRVTVACWVTVFYIKSLVTFACSIPFTDIVVLSV